MWYAAENVEESRRYRMKFNSFIRILPALPEYFRLKKCSQQHSSSSELTLSGNFTIAQLTNSKEIIKLTSVVYNITFSGCTGLQVAVNFMCTVYVQLFEFRTFRA